MIQNVAGTIGTFTINVNNHDNVSSHLFPLASQDNWPSYSDKNVLPLSPIKDKVIANIPARGRTRTSGCVLKCPANWRLDARE